MECIGFENGGILEAGNSFTAATSDGGGRYKTDTNYRKRNSMITYILTLKGLEVF
jgi:hypothetical protein